MSRAEARDELLIGGEPRVDLLPPEVRAQGSAKQTRRYLALGVVGVLVLTLGGVVLATFTAMQAQNDLQTEQARTQTILLQQQKYGEVRQVQTEVSLVEAGRKVGLSTEVDWKAYLLAVQKTLPSNVTIDTVTIDAATPLAVYAQPTSPLQGARVATLSFTAKSTTLPQVPTWLVGLAKLPGYADATPGSVTHDDTTNVYTVNITMHINSTAFTNRFTAKGK